MPAPINYMIQRPDIGGSLIEGLKLGTAVSNVRMQREQEAKKRAFQNDMTSFLTNPTAEKSLNLLKNYPEYSQQIQAAAKTGSEAEDKAEFDFTKKIFSATTSGNVDFAKTLTNERIEALKNSGQDTRAYERLLQSFDSANPKAAVGLIALQGAALFPEEWKKFAVASMAYEKEQAETEEHKAKSKKAASEAKFSDSILASQLEKNNWDIAKLQNDIEVAQQNRRIAAMEAVYKRETDDLKKQELQNKIDAAKEQRESTLRAKAAEGEATLLTADNTINTINKILKNPAWTDVVGLFEGGSYTGPLLTGLDEKEQEAIRDIETLGSQIFLNQVRQFGSAAGLTEKEGEKLQTSVQSTARGQSESAFKNNLLTIKAIVEKGRQNTINKYGIPDRPVQQFAPAEKKKMTGKGAMTPTQNMLEADRILSGGR